MKHLYALCLCASVLNNIASTVVKKTPDEFRPNVDTVVTDVIIDAETDPTVPAWAKEPTPPVKEEVDPVYSKDAEGISNAVKTVGVLSANTNIQFVVDGDRLVIATNDAVVWASNSDGDAIAEIEYRVERVNKDLMQSAFVTSYAVYPTTNATAYIWTLPQYFANLVEWWRARGYRLDTDYEYRDIVKAGTNETFVLLSTSEPGSFNVLVDWGDGTTSRSRDMAWTDDNHYAWDGAPTEHAYIFDHAYVEADRVFSIRIYGDDYYKHSHGVLDKDIVGHHIATNVFGGISYGDRNLTCAVDTGEYQMSSHLSSGSDFGGSRRVFVIDGSAVQPHSAARYKVANRYSSMSFCREIVGLKSFANSNVRSVTGLFNGCRILEKTDFAFPRQINEMNNTFSGCSSLTNDISGLFQGKFLSPEINVNNAFKNCTKLTGTVPAKWLWEDTSVRWKNTSTAFVGAADAIRAQVPVSWGGSNASIVVPAYSGKIPRGLLDVPEVVEADPTVPAWAKQEAPPEVVETDPTVPAWAKGPDKPIFDVAAIIYTKTGTVCLTSAELGRTHMLHGGFVLFNPVLPNIKAGWKKDTTVTNVWLSPVVWRLGHNAFRMCDGIKRLELPYVDVVPQENYSTIYYADGREVDTGARQFNQMAYLEELYAPMITSITHAMFNGDARLRRVNLDGVRTIYNSGTIFGACPNLEEVSFRTMKAETVKAMSYFPFGAPDGCRFICVNADIVKTNGTWEVIAQ